jgi:hypothetical protein
MNHKYSKPNSVQECSLLLDVFQATGGLQEHQELAQRFAEASRNLSPGELMQQFGSQLIQLMQSTGTDPAAAAEASTSGGGGTMRAPAEKAAATSSSAEPGSWSFV